MDSKRRLLRSVALCVLLGAVLNVAVAWSIAILPPPVYSDGSWNPSRQPRIIDECLYRCEKGIFITTAARCPGSLIIWQREMLWGYSSHGNPPREHDEFREYLPEWSAFQNDDLYVSSIPRPDEHGFGWGHEIATGWPMLTLRASAVCVVDYSRDLDGEVIITDGIAPPVWLGNTTKGCVLLPCRPIWPGFAINTAFYALIVAALWQMLLTPWRLRRWRRVRRGRCPACGYPAGISPVCTECGRDLPRKCLQRVSPLPGAGAGAGA